MMSMKSYQMNKFSSKITKFIKEEKFIVFFGIPAFVSMHYCMYQEFIEQSKRNNNK